MKGMRDISPIMQSMRNFLLGVSRFLIESFIYIFTDSEKIPLKILILSNRENTPTC
jgi:hypothetical protein